MKSIAIYTEVLPEGWEWTPDRYVGGTPEFAVEITKKLSQKYEVNVYYDNKYMEIDGVSFIPRKYYKPTDILIACNSVPYELCDKNIYWTSLFGDRDKDYKEFDHRIVLSEYHKTIFGKKSSVVGLGCHPELFMNGIKDEKLCLYSSSPDRGGGWLKSHWDKIAKETGAKLVCTYDKNISESEMVELYKKAKYWLHPCLGIELFCVSGLKAQAAGCIPIFVPEMALAETVKYGFRATDINDYEETIIKAINSDFEVPKIYIRSWDDVCNDIEALIS